MHASMDQHEVGTSGRRAAFTRVMDEVDRVIGVLALRRAEDARPPVPAEDIERLIAQRREARHARDFARADEIRRELDDQGIVLEDTVAGTRWSESGRALRTGKVLGN